LQVLGTAEFAQIPQRVRQQLHSIVPLVDAFKAEPQPLERLFPRAGPFDPHPQRMASGVDEPLPSTLGGVAMAWGVLEVGEPARMENPLAIVGGIKATIAGKRGASQGQPHRFGHLWQGWQTLR